MESNAGPVVPNGRGGTAATVATDPDDPAQAPAAPEEPKPTPHDFSAVNRRAAGCAIVALLFILVMGWLSGWSPEWNPDGGGFWPGRR